MFASETQENWLELLPFAEFTYNNTVHSSTGLSPFYIVYGENPRWTMHEDVHHEGEAPTAIDRIETMRNARRTAAEHLQKAQEQQQQEAQTLFVSQGRSHPLKRKEPANKKAQQEAGGQICRPVLGRRNNRNTGVPLTAPTLIQDPQCVPCLPPRSFPTNARRARAERNRSRCQPRRRRAVGGGGNCW